MENFQQMEQNSVAARSFSDPVSPEMRQNLGEIASLATSPMCPGCPSCDAFAKKTEYAFQDISRYVMYYEEASDLEARNYYHHLSDAQKNAGGVNLAQLRDSCKYNVDYPEIARRSEAYFA